jgi:hypothetical protein
MSVDEIVAVGLAVTALSFLDAALRGPRSLVCVVSDLLTRRIGEDLLPAAEQEGLDREFKEEALPALADLFERESLGVAAHALAHIERAYPPGHRLRRKALAKVNALATKARFDAMSLRDAGLAELDDWGSGR